MWPPTTGFGSKQAPAAGDVICGFRIPGGTQVAQNFAGLARLRSVWGDDAQVFRPERWLEVDDGSEEGKERLRMMSLVIDLGFGNGKYQCLGKRIALMELSKIFVEVCCPPTPV